LTLALGVGPTTALFAIIHGSLRLSYPNASQLVVIKNTYSTGSYLSVSLPDFDTWRRETPSFAQLVAFFPSRKTYVGKNEPYRLSATAISRDFFSVFGVRPVLGRDFSVSDQRTGALAACILDEGFWNQEFGRDKAVLGRGIILDDVTYTIVGVAPRLRPTLIREPAIWIPLEAAPPWTQHGTNYLVAVGRLSSGAGIRQATADLTVVQNRIDSAFPGNKHGIEVEPLAEALFGNMRRILLVILAAVAFVLLIACVNIASMLFARGADRKQEFTVRHMLGATPIRLLRQNTVESLCLSLAGCGLGLGLAFLLLRIPISAWPKFLEAPSQIHLDIELLLAVLGLILLTTVIFGAVPTLQTLRQNLRAATAGGRSTDSREDRIVRSILLVGEIGFATLLVAGALSMTMRFMQLLRTDPGMNPDHVLTMAIPLSPTRYADDDSQRRFFDTLLDRLRTLPGVKGVAGTSETPFDGLAETSDFEYDDETSGLKSQLPFAENYFVTPGYFQVVQTPILSGRTFTFADNRHAPLVAIVNERMAKRLWPGKQAVGRKIKFGGSWHQVVGVAGDVHSAGVSGAVPLQIYLTTEQHPSNSLTMLVRTEIAPLDLSEAAKRAVYQIDRLQPVSNVAQMDELASQSIAGENTTTKVTVALGALAMLLASIGVYGVTAYSVSRRWREFGVRMALGAQRSDILTLLMTELGALVASGIVLGGLLALIVGGWVSTQSAGSVRISATAFVPAAASLGILACVAALIPVRRATSVNPMEFLKSQ
jgi:putative ABC transport system permease protein